jgi:hypothetical protein
VRSRAARLLLILTLCLAPLLGIGQHAAQAQIPGCLAGDIVGMAATPSGAGYWLVGSDGGVFSYGDARFYGSMGGKPLNKPVVDIVPTQSGSGYWLIAADGGVFAFGDARPPAQNPLPSTHLNQPVVAGTRVGAQGLWLTAGDGGVFALGGAPFYGSMSGHPLNRPVVDVVSSADGKGYWLIAGDGGVFAFGDAIPPTDNPVPGLRLDDTHLVVGAARAGNTNGLWLAAKDGGVFALGGAHFYGSMGGAHLAKPVSGIAAPPAGGGYWMAARDGGVFAYAAAAFFGNAVSSNCPVTAPPSTPGSKIVQVATDIKNGKAEPGWGGGSVPYSWGGGHGTNAGPSKGTCVGYSGPNPGPNCIAKSTVGVDCSGFSRWVYRIAYGADVLGSVNTNGQIARLKKVTGSPAPGDLAFYGTGPSNTHHVGVYIGGGQMIDALKTGTYVRVDSVNVMADLIGYWRYQP